MESLRIALLKLEHSRFSAGHERIVASLKSGLLNCLADLEAERAILSSLTPGALESASTAAQTLTLSFAELQTLEEAIAQRPPHKLD
jgi:hypothetical protein